jgi:hypothetical protein
MTCYYFRHLYSQVISDYIKHVLCHTCFDSLTGRSIRGLTATDVYKIMLKIEIVQKNSSLYVALETAINIL